MSQELIQLFKDQTSDSIYDLLEKVGRRKGVDCVRYTGFIPATGNKPIYAIVSRHDVVFVLIDWLKPGYHTGDDSVRMLMAFMSQYLHAQQENSDDDDVPPFMGVVVTNTEYDDLEKMGKLWERLDIKVFHNIKANIPPEVYYVNRYHAVALAQYKAFYNWCVDKGYFKRDIYAFEDIDADYDEMEFGIYEDDDEMENDTIPCCESEEDFQALLDKMINGPMGAEIMDLEDDDELMPQSKDTSDIVEEVKKGKQQKNMMKGVKKVEVSVDVCHVVPEDGNFRITLTSKPGASLRPGRFYGYVFTDDYYPICHGDDIYEVINGRTKTMVIDIACKRIWLPGHYFLIISDNKDFSSVARIDFTLDKELVATTSDKWKSCGILSPECALAFCLSQAENWEYVAHTPGTSQIRQKMIQRTLIHFFNEFRKDSQGELPINNNMLVCMNNPSRTFLEKLQIVMAPDYNFKYIDCSKLFDASRVNPYEILPEKLDNGKDKVLCLTHLSELIGSSGKIIMRKVVDTILQSEGKTPIWLCGTRREIDETLTQYPSIKQFFIDDCWLMQQPNTAYELVQAFISIMADDKMEPDILAKPCIAQAIIDGCETGCLTDWTVADIKHFVESEIIPRYIKRNLLDFDAKDDNPLIVIEDVPLEKLTDSASSYEHSIIELNAMIGLDEVKRGISTMANQAHLFIERRRRGLKTSNNQVYHSIFTGNPGTGKTTVARQLGKIYHALGLLSRGEVIAVDRTKLIGQYIGQTEENMKSILEEAKGNVLFIDEAYTLFTGSDDTRDFGRRVLDCLLTVLTQPNADMLIVFAGYTKEMDAMLSTNPGLAGRFPYRYHFDDYSPEQLMEIAKSLFKQDEYFLTDEANKELQKSITETIREKPANFGNARWLEQFVRNGIIPAMANRIFETSCNDYQTIEARDVRKAYEKFNPRTIELKPRHRVAGFSA